MGDVDLSGLPPIYPVVPPSRGVGKDVGISQISISQTNFESAPAVIRADVVAVGFSGKPIVAVVSDENGKEVERQQMLATGDGKPLSFRFQFRPERKGENFYQVHAFAASDEKKAEQAPATSPARQRADARQQQPAGGHRSRGWSLPRALRERPPQLGVQIPPPRPRGRRTARTRRIVRIARRQPKFDFRNTRPGRPAPSSTGSTIPDAETAERSDQPVLIRLGTLDERGAEGRFSQDGRRALSLPRDHPRRSSRPVSSLRTSSPSCEIS